MPSPYEQTTNNPRMDMSFMTYQDVAVALTLTGVEICEVSGCQNQCASYALIIIFYIYLIVYYLVFLQSPSPPQMHFASGSSECAHFRSNLPSFFTILLIPIAATDSNTINNVGIKNIQILIIRRLSSNSSSCLSAQGCICR